MQTPQRPIASLIPTLLSIYGFVDQWHRSMPGVFSCTKGCGYCCTDQVTATEVEAALIANTIARNPRSFLFNNINNTQVSQQLLTTNEFALACLQGREVPLTEQPLNPAKCIFLDGKGHCTIYDRRPLMCRLFVSSEPCNQEGIAVVPEHVLTFGVILQQIVEHLCAGYRWGNLIWLLQDLTNERSSESDVFRHCLEAPGFLVHPREENYIKQNLRPLLTAQGIGQSERENLKNIVEKWFVGLFEAPDKN